jgi:hypothetical protein
MQTVIKSNMSGTGRHWMKFALCRTGRQAVKYSLHGTGRDRLYCTVLYCLVWAGFNTREIALEGTCGEALRAIKGRY